MASQITPFNGDRNPRRINDYIWDCQDRFCGDNDLDRRLVLLLLRDSAILWIERVRETSEWTQLSGQELLDRLKKDFMPFGYEQDAIRAISTLNRGSSSVAAYLNRFMELKLEISKDAISEDKYGYFLAKGCGEPYASDIRRGLLRTYPEVLAYLQRQANTWTNLPGYHVSL